VEKLTPNGETKVTTKHNKNSKKKWGAHKTREKDQYPGRAPICDEMWGVTGQNVNTYGIYSI